MAASKRAPLFHIHGDITDYCESLDPGSCSRVVGRAGRGVAVGGIRRQRQDSNNKMSH